MELLDLLKSGELENLKNIRILGLMRMATNTSNTEQIRKEFRGLKNLFE